MAKEMNPACSVAGFWIEIAISTNMERLVFLLHTLQQDDNRGGLVLPIWYESFFFSFNFFPRFCLKNSIWKKRWKFWFQYQENIFYADKYKIVRISNANLKFAAVSVAKPEKIPKKHRDAIDRTINRIRLILSWNLWWTELKWGGEKKEIQKYWTQIIK